MAENSSDPVQAWRNMLGEWEKNVNAFANQTMERQEFGKLMGTVTGAGTAAQGVVGDVMQRYLATLNLPSRAELASIGERLGAVEAQMNQLIALVRTIPGVTAPLRSEAPRPARTRQPPVAKPADAKPADTKQVDTKPVDAQPVDMKAASAEPALVEPAFTELPAISSPPPRSVASKGDLL